jgi:hypothetical protein
MSRRRHCALVLWNLLLVLAAVGCSSARTWTYSVSSPVNRPPLHDQTVAVPPLNDERIALQAPSGVGIMRPQDSDSPEREGGSHGR